MPHSLFLQSGARKYLNGEERRLLLRSAHEQGGEKGLFCWVLIETGCRISEALALAGRNIDIAHRSIIVECLKKRKRSVYRAIPVSDALIQDLNGFFRLKDRYGLKREERLWQWCRMTAYRHVTSLMTDSGVHGPHATPKGLRHGFGVAAVSAGIPLNLVQRWLGHADMRTTAIYANVSGEEERRIASRMWGKRDICSNAYRRGPTNVLQGAKCNCPRCGRALCSASPAGEELCL